MSLRRIQSSITPLLFCVTIHGYRLVHLFIRNQIRNLHDQLVHNEIQDHTTQYHNMQCKKAVCKAGSHDEDHVHVCNNWNFASSLAQFTWVLLAHQLRLDVREERLPIETIIPDFEQHASQNTLRNDCHQTLKC